MPQSQQDRKREDREREVLQPVGLVQGGWCAHVCIVSENVCASYMFVYCVYVCTVSVWYGIFVCGMCVLCICFVCELVHTLYV